MSNQPNHIAIIPDGNRRWAKQNKLLPWSGHEKGIGRFREIADAVFERHIPYLTIWAASEDNLTKRSKHEVRFLIALLTDWIQKEIDKKDFVRNGIRVRFIGRWRQIVSDHEKLARAIGTLEAQTKNLKKSNLTVLLGYDGRREMIEAIRHLQKNKVHEVADKSLHDALWTGALPPLDLVIRTGGEPHWSAGFMMWHAANTQLAFTKTFWPAFKKKELDEILVDFSKRERRFGK
jgi:undecaprenyl diphosphate synthase